MSRKSYVHAWQRGYRAAVWFGRLAIRPVWRGKKYRQAWDHGYAAGLIAL